jgi:predicted transcriptional regulator of viral defense system
VDALDRPAYAGDVPEIAAMLWRGQGRLDWERLAGYALRMRSQALVQRLGYLADLLHLPLETPVRDRLLADAGKSTPYLGRPGRWGIGGAYDAVWRIVDNVPRQELMAEIQVGSHSPSPVPTTMRPRIRAAQRSPTATTG